MSLNITYSKEQLGFITEHKNKNNAEMKNGVRLIDWLYGNASN